MDNANSRVASRLKTPVMHVKIRFFFGVESSEERLLINIYMKKVYKIHRIREGSQMLAINLILAQLYQVSSVLLTPPLPPPPLLSQSLHNVMID